MKYIVFEIETADSPTEGCLIEDMKATGELELSEPASEEAVLAKLIEKGLIKHEDKVSCVNEDGQGWYFQVLCSHTGKPLFHVKEEAVSFFLDGKVL